MRRARWLPGLGLLLFITFGLSLVPDFGISWDESASRANGLVSLKHVLERFGIDYLADDPYLLTVQTALSDYHDRDYGVAFEASAGMLERSLGLLDTREIFLFRHALTFLASTVGLIAVFAICRRRYGTAWAGVVACVLLVTSPRQFAESFYNSKDILLMAFVAAAIATHLRLLLQPSVLAALAHAVATALAINIRVTAVGVALLTVVTLLAAVALVPEQRRKYLIALLLYVAATAVFTVAAWPYLWDAPWSNFVAAVENMARFRWPGGVFFQGQVYAATALPWYYLPIWIAQTTPLHVLLFFGLGLVAISTQTARVVSGKSKVSRELVQDAVLLLYVFGPVVGLIALDAVLYDGWRQAYFAYPPLICVACGGFVWAIQRLSVTPRLRLAMGLFAASCVVLTVVWMVRAHPHSHVYFNALAKKPWIEHYDTDYWSVSGTDALKIALRDSRSDSVGVWAASSMHLAMNQHMLSAEDRARLRLVDSKEAADYVVTNYRERWNRPDDILERLTLVEHIWAGDQIICSVFRTDRPPSASPPD
jgi:hypothetical protein